MKKLLTILSLNFFWAISIVPVHAQMKIGDNPRTIGNSAILELESASKALLLSRVNTVADIAQPANGIMVYDISKNCIRFYENNKWSACVSLASNLFRSSGGTAIVDAYDCGSGTAEGIMVQGAAVSAVTQTVRANVVTPGTYNITAVANGVTFSASGTFTTAGQQEITLTATGTPVASGDFSFNLSTDPSCTFSRSVLQALPTGLTLDNGLPHFILSVYDEDYLPFTFPTESADYNMNVPADGEPEFKVLDIQGVLASTRLIPVYIPFTNSNLSSVNLPAYSQIITIDAGKTANGMGGQLQLAFDAQLLPVGKGTIRATLKALGSDILVKQLDLQNGTGKDNKGVLLCKFSYPAGSSSTAQLEVRAIAGIPDRMFNVPDNAGNDMTHLFLYRPVSSPTGQIWLSNNLGATYTEIFNVEFNPEKQAVSVDDSYALGSWFQWGRKADGHELYKRNFESGDVGFVYSKPVITLADNPVFPIVLPIRYSVELTLHRIMIGA